MANATATKRTPRRRRRARPVTFLCHRLLRFLPTSRLRRRRLGLTTTSTGHEAEAAAAAAQPRQGDAAGDGKYWPQRRSLFTLYDRGVRMDAEGWYSATPEAIAAAQAARAPPGSVVVDAFAGVGANSIQFAARGCYVVAVEIDPRKVELAAHNASRG